MQVPLCILRVVQGQNDQQFCYFPGKEKNEKVMRLFCLFSNLVESLGQEEEGEEKKRGREYNS